MKEKIMNYEIVLKEDVLCDWFWRNIPLGIEMAEGNYFDLYRNMKRLGSVYVINKELYLETIWGFSQIIWHSKTIRQLCNEIMAFYPEARKMSIYLIEGDWYGNTIFRKSGFVEEVHLYNYAKYAGKKRDGFILSYFRDNL